MLSVPRKKTGRPPGRPRAGEEPRAKPGEVRTLYVDVPGVLWNRVQDALDRARVRTGFKGITKADVVVSLLTKALEQDEAEGKPPV